jgi:hypothetical protein
MEQSPSWEIGRRSVRQDISYVYTTRSFITMFPTARHWSLSWVRWIHSTTYRQISHRPVALSFHLHLYFMKRTSYEVPHYVVFSNPDYLKISHESIIERFRSEYQWNDVVGSKYYHRGLSRTEQWLQFRHIPVRKVLVIWKIQKP